MSVDGQEHQARRRVPATWALVPLLLGDPFSWNATPCRSCLAGGKAKFLTKAKDMTKRLLELGAWKDLAELDRAYLGNGQLEVAITKAPWSLTTGVHPANHKANKCKQPTTCDNPLFCTPEMDTKVLIRQLPQVSPCAEPLANGCSHASPYVWSCTVRFCLLQPTSNVLQVPRSLLRDGDEEIDPRKLRLWIPPKQLIYCWRCTG